MSMKIELTLISFEYSAIRPSMDVLFKFPINTSNDAPFDSSSRPSFGLSLVPSVFVFAFDALVGFFIEIARSITIDKVHIYDKYTNLILRRCI